MIDETRYKETTATSTGVDRPRMETRPSPSYGYGYTPPAAETRSRIVAWGPIWAGVVIAVGVQVTLAVLGLAIGLTIAQTTQTGEAFNVAAGIWWVITALAAFFIGGWAAAWMAAPRRPIHGGVQGLVLWAVITALGAALLTTTGGMLAGGGLGIMGQDLTSTGQTGMAQTEQFVRPDERGAADRFTMQQGTQQQVAETTTGVAWWTFVVLLLSAGAAMIGGAVGHRTPEQRRYA